MAERLLIEYKVRQRVYERQDGRCVYCGERKKIQSMTVEHVIPLSRGGTYDESNLRYACRECNHMKGNMLPTEFSVYLHRMFLNNLELCKLEFGRGNVS